MQNLQEVDLLVYSDEECYDIHGSQLNPNNICAGVLGGGKGQCNVIRFGNKQSTLLMHMIPG